MLWKETLVLRVISGEVLGELADGVRGGKTVASTVTVR